MSTHNGIQTDSYGDIVGSRMVQDLSFCQVAQ